MSCLIVLNVTSRVERKSNKARQEKREERAENGAIDEKKFHATSKLAEILENLFRREKTALENTGFLTIPMTAGHLTREMQEERSSRIRSRG